MYTEESYPNNFPYSLDEVEIIEKWRWKTTFRWKKGHLKRFKFYHDAINHHIWRERPEVEFCFDNYDSQSKATNICHKQGFYHAVCGMTNGYCSIWMDHRLASRFIKALRKIGFKVTILNDSKKYLVKE